MRAKGRVPQWLSSQWTQWDEIPSELNLQSLNINARVAAEAADMLTRLLLTNSLKRYACELNLAAGVVRSKYITRENLASFMPKEGQ